LTHRREVRDAILENTADLVANGGLLAVTMSQIAEMTGIGRATLYKYFPDVGTILLEWHERQIARHLKYLGDVRDRIEAPAEQLPAVLEAYALISHEIHDKGETELTAFLHRDRRVAQAEEQLHQMIRDLVPEASEDGEVRDDVAPAELATYCLHALGAARSLSSKTAVRRLVAVTLTGLQRPA
jgi:AcrR family transcriptional regulator